MAQAWILVWHVAWIDVLTVVHSLVLEFLVSWNPGRSCNKSHFKRFLLQFQGPQLVLCSAFSAKLKINLFNKSEFNWEVCNPLAFEVVDFPNHLQPRSSCFFWFWLSLPFAVNPNCVKSTNLERLHLAMETFLDIFTLFFPKTISADFQTEPFLIPLKLVFIKLVWFQVVEPKPSCPMVQVTGRQLWSDSFAGVWTSITL